MATFFQLIIIQFGKSEGMVLLFAVCSELELSPPNDGFGLAY